MLKNIEISAFLKELGDDNGGMSRPVLILGDDGNTYILKNQTVYDPRISKWVNWNSMFLQEVLVYNLAKFLDVKIPDCVITNVEKDFLDHAPTLQFQHRYSTGLHFASRLLDKVENNLMGGFTQLIQMGKPYTKTSWNHFFNGIYNTQDIPKVIALDLLTLNLDRFGNEGNLLISKETGNRNMYIIDHGHCFRGPIWDLDKRNMLLSVANNNPYLIGVLDDFYRNNGGKPMSGLGLIFSALDQHIDVSNPDNHSFEEAVNLIEQLNPTIIDEWFKDVPDEWFVDKQQQISLYKNFLLKQKDLIRIFINKMAAYGAFKSHRGGNLNWKKSTIGIQ